MSPSFVSTLFPRLALVLSAAGAMLAAPGAQAASPTPAAPATTAAAAGACPDVLQRQFPRLQDEKPQPLCQYAGKVVLVVNTASFCGFTPQYKALEALSSKYKDLAGDDRWKKLTPPSGAAVYIYNDTIDGVAINVSQQHLPDSFKKDTESKIADLAKKYNASTALVTDDVNAFIGTSAKGPQSVIFSKGEALVLIKSESVISNQLWTQYLETLE